MYPAYVTTYLTPKRTRLPIHTHNTHKFIDRDDDSLISLSFAIRMTNFMGDDDQTRIRFYTPHQSEFLRLEEELHSHINDFKFEFQPSHFSVYGFNTENSPHTALCGEDLYCWLVFDYVQLIRPFEYQKFKFSQNILAHNYF